LIKTLPPKRRIIIERIVTDVTAERMVKKPMMDR